MRWTDAESRALDLSLADCLVELMRLHLVPSAAPPKPKLVEPHGHMVPGRYVEAFEFLQQECRRVRPLLLPDGVEQDGDCRPTQFKTGVRHDARSIHGDSPSGHSFAIRSTTPGNSACGARTSTARLAR